MGYMGTLSAPWPISPRVRDVNVNLSVRIHEVQELTKTYIKVGMYKPIPAHQSSQVSQILCPKHLQVHQWFPAKIR